MMTDEEMVECADASRQMERLRAIMHRLRAPGGCPWDAEQTHESIISNLIEEAYEAVDTIKRGDVEHMKEELGDLLLQVVFHAEIAEGNGHFNFDDVAREISEKLVRRHPHVYGASEVENTEGVLNQWDAIKLQEKGGVSKGLLDGVGDGLPGLLKAYKLQKKASKVGFDWPDVVSVLDKVREELAEVEEEIEKREEHGAKNERELEAEVGDLLFSVVNVARKLGVDPEVALDGTNHKFLRRFSHMERALEKEGRDLGSASLDEMEAHWQEAKHIASE
ncbi:nucleoside triphosphate pyrophosphohydrolase [Rubritalea tangerina]|uniref:Nucleoside triphosphate pyrophosphohydrolase n=1 Tax=Rubritalea tangerina TaxID=430798 RepID=A0ABW4ZAC9_9BACT